MTLYARACSHSGSASSPACRENTYTSATIEVTEGQRVITTGPYAFVRHPMYASALVYVVGTPLALGSCWGFLALALMLRYRLVPFLW
jgi:protein-S-isoprenylcysteine O-methyltransferase Ste14